MQVSKIKKIVKDLQVFLFVCWVFQCFECWNEKAQYKGRTHKVTCKEIVFAALKQWDFIKPVFCAAFWLPRDVSLVPSEFGCTPLCCIFFMCILLLWQPQFDIRISCAVGMSHRPHIYATCLSFMTGLEASPTVLKSAKIKGRELLDRQFLFSG